MLSLPPSVRIYVCTEPTDMRKSFDGLACAAKEFCKDDPFSGHLFVFGNKRHDRIKILFWDNDGFVVYAKRLEEGTFRFPSGDSSSMQMTSEELYALLSGFEFSSVKRRKRYRRPL